MTSFQTLRTDVSHRVAAIWLNRPERRNAFSWVMTRELYEWPVSKGKDCPPMLSE
jgi:enoyl-CoA hydratase/carnithine racemase